MISRAKNHSPKPQPSPPSRLGVLCERKPRALCERQGGSVIIVTLWTITLLTVLVTVIASENRLSARAALYQQEDLAHWAGVIGAVNQAEMELMLERMPRPPEVVEDVSQVGRRPEYRFNGGELELNYPAADDVTVRIYDHAGKINLNEISRARLRALIENKIGEDQDDRVDELLAAWNDWQDLNDLQSVIGAEVDYYQELDQPYRPRNGPFETVDELLLIRGFDEVFADVDLEAAFTLFGDNELVNLNLATVEAMQLLPGLNDELIEEIIAFRQENEFRGNGDVARIVPAENMAELRFWINNRKTTNYYTILAYPSQRGTLDEDGQARPLTDEEQAEAGFLGLPDVDLATNAFSQTVEVRTFNERPKILRINPYERIPARVYVEPEE